jgi:hypothetical protein
MFRAGKGHMSSAEQEYQQKRSQSREDEYQESFSLLLELVNQEPTLTQAFRIIQTQVLHGDIRLQIDGVPASPAFMRFAEDHYVPFSRDAIKAMFTYGFVPWHFRTLRSGDVVPEVLPAGTFTWSVIQSSAASKGTDYGDDGSKQLLYDVKLLHAGDTLRREDVFIFESCQPTWNVAQGSQIHSSYPSPLSHLVNDYKNLRTAMSNKAHADTWNTQAHIVTKQQSKTFQQDPTATFLEAGVNSNNQYTYEKAQLQLHTRDQDIQEMFNKKATGHMPYVYTLPMDVSLEHIPQLVSSADIPFLDARFKHEISMVTGVPSELLTNRGASNESSTRTRTSSTQFHTSMDTIARTLQRLLKSVYTRAYHNRGPTDRPVMNTTNNTCKQPNERKRKACVPRTPDIKWYLEVTPPLALETVDDLVKLASVEGALNPNELRRVVHMLLYGKGTPGGGTSSIGTASKSASSSSLPPESFVHATPKEKPKNETSNKETSSTKATQ